MDQSVYLHLLSTDPVVTAKVGLRFVHFIGLALGLGGATLLDLMLVRFFVRETVSRESWKIVHFFSSIVNVGLILLWATGIGFVVHYAFFDPVKLMNEKIWAKLAIVLVLSVNGMFIHAVVLPRIRAQIGKTLLAGMSRFQRCAFLISGAVSATSWYVPAILGVFPQLNFSVPATTILLTYSLLLVVVIVAMHAIMALIEPSSRLRKNPSPWVADLAFYHESAEARMRGAFVDQGRLFSCIPPEERVPANHPLRKVRELVRAVLSDLSHSLSKLYASEGRPSIPPEQLLSALLLQVFYGIRSERQLMEQLDCNLLYRWFVGLSPDAPVWDPTVFTKNRDRLQNGEVFARFMSKLLRHPQVKPLLSDEHFSVDGTLIEAWASQATMVDWVRSDKQRRNRSRASTADERCGEPLRALHELCGILDDEVIRRSGEPAFQ